MDYDCKALSAKDRYKLLIGCITPRPIAWVSSVSPNGAPNLAPYSFFTGVGSNPMTLLFCPANDDAGGEKDSLRNAKPIAEGGTGCFVVNIVSEAQAASMAVTAEALPYGESEFDLAGLQPTPAQAVAAPRVAGAPAGFECRTLQVLRLHPGQAAGGNIVIGEVVHAWVDEALIDARLHVDPEGLATVGRMGGPTLYCRTRDTFTLPRGRPEGPTKA